MPAQNLNAALPNIYLLCQDWLACCQRADRLVMWRAARSGRLC